MSVATPALPCDGDVDTKLDAGQAFWQPIECPGQLGTRSWDQKTQSWLSHSRHWVCPEHAGTRRLFSWIFLPNYSHPPRKMTSTPFTKNRLLVPWFSCSTGWGVMNWAVLMKKKVKQWAPFSYQTWIFKSIIDGPQIAGPHPQNRSDRIEFVHFWRRGSGLGGARVEAARACWRCQAADQTQMVMVMWWVPKIALA